MRIADILLPENIFLGVECKSKKAALDSLSFYITQVSPMLDQQAVLECLTAREKLGSTGIGHGIAIPHGRLKYNPSILSVFIKLLEPVEFDAVDNQPVDMCLGLIVPEESSQEHAEVLQSLAKTLEQGGLIDKLRQSQTPYELYDLLVLQ